MKRRNAITLTAAFTLLFCQALLAAPAEPLRAQYADISEKMELKISWQSFSGMEVDEVEDFDGWTATAEFSVPFAQRFRLRLNYPFKTKGDARVKDDQPMQQGERVDVEGNGGVYDFMILAFEHQLIFAQDSGYNLAYYINGGRVPGRLETTKKDIKVAGTFDPMNHTGMMFGGGVLFDRAHSFGQIIANLGLRYYTDSDDLHPDGSDSFPALDAKLAWIGSPWGTVHPAVEVTYLGDFSDLNQFSLLPELLFTHNNFDLKLGAEIGLGGSGNDLGAVLQAGIHF